VEEANRRLEVAVKVETTETAKPKVEMAAPFPSMIIDANGSFEDKEQLLYAAAMKCSVPAFTQALEVKNQVHAESHPMREGKLTSMSYEAIKDFCRIKYHELMKSHSWNLTSRTGAAFQAAVPGATQFQIGHRGRQGGRGQQGGDSRGPEWNAPGEGESETRTIDGAQHVYCRRCRRWRASTHAKAHTTPNHVAGGVGGGGDRDRSNSRERTAGRGGRGGRGHGGRRGGGRAGGRSGGRSNGQAAAPAPATQGGSYNASFFFYPEPEM
jgi:hypothetical protein